MITRYEAKKIIDKLLQSELLSDDMEDSLRDIKECIMAGDIKTGNGFDIWGAKDDDWRDLFKLCHAGVFMNVYELSVTTQQHLRDTYNRYRIKENDVLFDDWVEGR